MKKKHILNYFMIIIGVIIIVFVCYFLFSNKKTQISFNLNEKNVQLKIGETKKIGYELSDSNLNIEWRSSNSNITINNNGEITASDYGTSIITAIVNNGEETITDYCDVIAYSGNIDNKLERIDVLSGYLLMKPNSEFDLPFDIVPSDAYITSINYSIGDENVAIINDNKITSLQSGSTYLNVTINNNTTAGIDIMVSEDALENGIVKMVDKAFFETERLTIKINEVKTLLYNIDPVDAYIYSKKWISSDESVVRVNDGEIKGINTGEAVVSLVINETIETSIIIKVESKNVDIKIDYNPKILIRIGEKTSIKSHVEPTDTSDTITYKSSNPSVAIVNNGVITGISSGSSVITLSIANGKTKSFTINVLPLNGTIEGSGNLWGYKSLNAKTPVLADTLFFLRLSQNGIGLMQGNTYIITALGQTYSYDINSSLLSVSNKKIQLRIYYPPNEDLSSLNTLVFMGGRGETNFYGMFSDAAKDPSIMKSAGILGLIAEGNKTSFDGASGAYVTKFLKAITQQKSGIKNSILGFSDGAHQVLQGAITENYDKIIIFSGYCDGIATLENAKDKEIIFIIASNDGNYRQMKTAVNTMKASGYKNVTIVSNGADLFGYTDRFLVIRPVGLIKNGHLSQNVLLSGIIEYAND